MMGLTAAILLEAWEAGAAAAPIDRAPSLLHSLGAIAAEADVGNLTVGQCDASLFQLRRALFGEALELVATCPACQTDVELTIQLLEIQPPVSDDRAGDVTIEVGDLTVAGRVPRNADLAALATRGAGAELRDLVRMCVRDASTSTGRAVGLDELAPDTLEAIAEALAESDPGAHMAVGIRCPCGEEWVDELDIRTIIWSDLTEWVGRTLTEVHQLAQSYGWSEAESLAMGSWRRCWYLEAAGW